MIASVRYAFGLLVLSATSSLAAQAAAPSRIVFYDSVAALQYAKDWCRGGNACTSGTNGQFKTDNNTDCTHFMAHVLAAGGVEVPGIGAKCDKKLVVRVAELGKWLEDATKTYANVKKVADWQQTKAGDLAFATGFTFHGWDLSVNGYQHAMLLVETAKADGALVYAHSTNKCGEATGKFAGKDGTYFRIDPSPLDGVWLSADDAHRFKLKISGRTVEWTENRKSGDGKTFVRQAKLEEKEPGHYRLERQNDDDALQSLGFSAPALRAAILQKSPLPSHLTLTLRDGKLSGDWAGLLIRKDKNGALEAVVQPGAGKVMTYGFTKQ